jgi:prepilin-type N-terminal cleavage/methylation domain-containing protein
MRNSNAGFTLAELVVSIVLVGIVMSVAIPTYSNLTNQAQREINLANMSIIKDTFLRYYQETHIKGNPQLPTEPENNLLDEEYRQIVLSDGRTPNYLFSGDLPLNTNNNAFHYEILSDTSEQGYITKLFIISDVDEDSPSYEEYRLGEI